MTLAKRIAVFAVLWLLAGAVVAVFSDITVEAGESEWLVRFQVMCLAPLVAALGVTFAIVHGSHGTAPQSDNYESIVCWLLSAFFAAHAVIALTRQKRRQFIMLSIVQVLFLAASVPCVLYFFHYEATHGKG
jgi:hypothetical protein